jgi:hypothetical protein
MPKYIIYVLRPDEEYVVGVHKWILYDLTEDALIKFPRDYAYAWVDFERWVGSRGIIVNSVYEIGQHVKILTGPTYTGFIARIA